MAPIRPHLRRIQLSGIQDDPFARSAELVQLQPSDFKRKGGRPIGLEGPRVKLVEPAYLGADQWFGERANNPFSLPKATSEGQFLFPDEPRFPSYVVEKGADGNEVRDDHGRMHWTLEKPVHLGQLVAYKAASDVSRAYEAWGRQPVEWGQGGKLVIYVHDSIELNAYYDRNDRALHMSVLPYVDKETGQPRLFEMASSYEISAHESGHAIHHVLKPFRSPEDSNFDAFGESMGDQTAMWVSLRDSERVKQLLTETGGDLSKSNALTAFGEHYGYLEPGETGPDRNAIEVTTVSNTKAEPHARSGAVTSAAYRVFCAIYDEKRLRQGRQPADAVRQAADTMGLFLTKVHDYMPERTIALEDVGKAYLSADKELFGGRYHDTLVREFGRSELLSEQAVKAWEEERAKLPKLTLRPRTSAAVRKLVDRNPQSLELLGIGKELGLQVLSVVVDGFGQHVVRVQLTSGRGEGAVPLQNYGLLVFRKDGTLGSYQSPITAGDYRLPMVKVSDTS